MQHTLMKMMNAKEPDALETYLSEIDDSWSFLTFVDELIPALVMESNLQFGSFHLIKMSLFLRNLSRRRIFSFDTEKAVAGVILRHLYYLEWIQISANAHVHAPDPVENPIENMIEEIEDGNVHNAYFYALVALREDKERLFNSLMRLGTQNLADTIGHSISCFYPVLTEMFAADHPASGTALLSLIMYFCRYRYTHKNYKKKTEPFEGSKSKLLRRCAKDHTIFDLHQMITFYTMQSWEQEVWNDNQLIPWSKLSAWTANKTEADYAEYVSEKDNSSQIPETYAEWDVIFRGHDQKKIITVACQLVSRDWEKTCDWLFRAYCDYYTPDWDPHYFTGLYAALHLYKDQTINRSDSQAAFIQALLYFLDDRDEL